MRKSKIPRCWNIGRSLLAGNFVPVRWLSLVAILIAMVFSACQTPRTAMVSDPPEAVAMRTPVTLEPGDLVKFSFPGAPELNQAQKVRADGRVSLPLVGEVYVRGKTPGGLQAELGTLYKSQLQNNSVVVSLENSSALIYVSGAVLKPGKVVVDRPMTVFEAIMEAGGFDPDYSNPKKVTLLRRENGVQTSRTLDLSPAFKGEPFSSSYVRAYDVIYVPQRMF